MQYKRLLVAERILSTCMQKIRVTMPGKKKIRLWWWRNFKIFNWIALSYLSATWKFWVVDFFSWSDLPKRFWNCFVYCHTFDGNTLWNRLYLCCTLYGYKHFYLVFFEIHWSWSYFYIWKLFTANSVLRNSKHYKYNYEIFKGKTNQGNSRRE